MRGKKFGKIKRTKKAADLDITSLLDILVILLVFLLSVYSSSDLDIEVVDNLSLPSSVSPMVGSQEVLLQVDFDRGLWLEGKNIGGGDPREWKGEKVESLFMALMTRKREQMDAAERGLASEELEGEAFENKRINILLDQRLPYEVLHKVMHTSALAGFTEFKFIVESRY